MKKVVFLRPAPYSDRMPGKDMISSFDLIGLQKCDPRINIENENIKKRINYLLKEFTPAKVYSSPAMRGTETAELFGLVFEVSSLLKEIKFSLTGTLSSKLLSAENTDVNQLRKGLIDAFVKNKIEENPQETIIRITSFFKVLKGTSGNIICISHAFVMKFYEIFFRKGGIIKDSTFFLSEYNWEIKPYGFLEGFCVSVDNIGNIQDVELLRDSVI